MENPVTVEDYRSLAAFLPIFSLFGWLVAGAGLF
jgi:hypothetical protein